MRPARGRTAIQLRRWLLAGAVVLVAGLAGVLGYANFRAHRFDSGLPHTLGIDIKSETNGFTFSKSNKGRTLFTMHASKAIQRQNGKTTLHDVDITLYGHAGTGQADRIRSAEFEYDQPNGVVRATGEVYLDLLSPAGASLQSAPGSGDERRIKATTDGLVFLEKLGVAATDGQIRFTYGAMTGEARGADYDADSGTLRLRHDVHVVSAADGRPSTLTAEAAELDRVSRKATLRGAQLSSAARHMSAATMFLTMRKDGSLEGVEAEGDVRLATEAGEHLAAPRLSAQLTATNRIQQIHMLGGIQFTGKGSSATASEGTLLFDAAGAPSHAVLLHRVSLRAGGQRPGDDRELTAERVTAELLTDTTQHLVAKSVAAQGQAKLVLTSAAPAGGHPAVTSLQGDSLQTQLVPQAGRWSVKQVEGKGNTRLHQDDGHGLQRTSTGDALLIVLHGDAKTRGEDAIVRAVQQGHVVLDERRAATTVSAAAPAKAASESHATAQQAEFTGATQELVLTGSPEVMLPGVELAANRIRVSQATGDAVAEGSVKGSYWNSATSTAAQPETMHVVAERADLSNGNDHVVFQAARGAVRLWNGTSQLEAPVVEWNRGSGTLHAHALVAAQPFAVRAVLPGSGSTARTRGGAVRVSSRDLAWTEGTGAQAGQAIFGGGVRVQQPESTLTADSATAYLRPAGSRSVPAPRAPAAPLAGTLERVVATGAVTLHEPGREGTGERLVYTAGDGRFELTGTPAREPEVVDSVRGSIRGTALIFHAGDDSVEVAGSPGSRVRSETHVKASAGRSN